MEESLCASGPDPKAERSKKAACSRIETTQGEWGERSDHLQRKGGAEKESSSSRDSFYINARSILSKFDQFETYVYYLNPDIIGVTESWTDSRVLDSELAIDGYDLFRQDRPVELDGG